MKRIHKLIIIGVAALAVIVTVIIIASSSCTSCNPQPSNTTPPPVLDGSPDNTLAPGETPVDGETPNPSNPVHTQRPDMGLARPERKTEPSIPYAIGMIAANDNVVIGARSDGKVMVAGYTEGNILSVVNLSNIVKVVVNDGSALALSRTGEVYIRGELSNYSDAVNSWNDICDIAIGDGFVVGLTADGTLVSQGITGDELSSWSGIVGITANGSRLVGITSEGKLKVFGDAALATATAGYMDVVQVEVSESHLVALHDDGTLDAVLLTGSEDVGQIAVNGLTDIARVYVDANKTIAIGTDGHITAAPALAELDEIVAAAQVCFVGDAYVVRHTDGGISIVGETNDRIKKSTAWELSCYSQGEYFMGFMPETTAKDAVEQICAATGVGNVYFKQSDGKRMVVVEDTELIRTGMEVYINGKKSGQIIIKGDVNCDGLITGADADYLNKAESLNDAEKLAAEFNGYTSVNVDTLLRNAAAGKVRISQFGSYGNTDMWNKFLGARSINSDVLGYISINGTIIDYPILWGEEFYYNDRDINKQSTGSPGSGSIYTYYSIPGRNTTVTGHNMRTAQTMFHALHDIQDNKEELLIPENRIIEMILWGEHSEWEIFALYETAHEEPTTTLEYNTKLLTSDDSEGIRAWISTQIRKSELDIGVEPDINDTFVTLVTCGDEYGYDTAQSRLYIFLRRVA